jgi:hypothetical protein
MAYSFMIFLPLLRIFITYTLTGIDSAEDGNQQQTIGYVKIVVNISDSEKVHFKEQINKCLENNNCGSNTGNPGYPV